MHKVDKVKIHAEILKQLQDNYDALAESAQIAKEASTNEESKAENKYDTRGLEASYLAGAQSKRALDLKEKIYQVSRVNLNPYNDELPIGVGALVKLNLIETDEVNYVFLLPSGGVSVKVSKEIEVKSISVSSPIGRLICGKFIGDEFKFKDKFYEIEEVL